MHQRNKILLLVSGVLLSAMVSVASEELATKGSVPDDWQATPSKYRIPDGPGGDLQIVGHYVGFARFNARFQLYLFADHTYAGIDEHWGNGHIHSSGSWAYTSGLLRLTGTPLAEAGRIAETRVILPLKTSLILGYVVLVDSRFSGSFPQVLAEIERGSVPSGFGTPDIDEYVLAKSMVRDGISDQEAAEFKERLEFENAAANAARKLGLFMMSGTNVVDLPPLINYLDLSVRDKFRFGFKTSGPNFAVRAPGIAVRSEIAEIPFDFSRVSMPGKARVELSDVTLQADGGLTISSDGTLSVKELWVVPKDASRVIK